MRRRSSIEKFSVAVAFGLFPIAGYATHPYLTDDTGTQGKGNWQLELQSEHNRFDRRTDPGGGMVRQERRSTLFNPVLTYGLLENLDVALSLNAVRDRTTEDGVLVQSAGGRGDSSVEAKWRFFDSGGLSLGLQPSITLPTGNVNRGLGSGRASWGINSILIYEVNAWTWRANVAYAEARFKLPADADAHQRHLWRVSAGFSYALHDKFRVVAEAGIRTNHPKNDVFQPGRYGQFAMIGAIYSPSEKLDFDVGFRWGLNKAEPDLTVLAGATVRWQ